MKPISEQARELVVEYETRPHCPPLDWQHRAVELLRKLASVPIDRIEYEATEVAGQ